MDFKEIQNIWKTSFNEEQLSPAQLEAMLKIKSRSNTALKKLKNSFRFELITGGLMYLFIIFAIILLLDFPLSIIFFIIVSGLMVIPLLFYYKTYRKIRDTIYTDSTLKNSLIQTTHDIEKFVKIGQGNILRFILIPFAIVTGMTIGLFIGTGETDIIEIFNHLETRTFVKMIVLLAVFTGVLIPFSRHWYKKKFQQHFKELKDCLKQFEENENI